MELQNLDGQVGIHREYDKDNWGHWPNSPPNSFIFGLGRVEAFAEIRFGHITQIAFS